MEGSNTSTRTKPVTVYLDTQDWVNLSRDASEFDDVKKYLDEEFRSGTIQTGYSYPLIFETFRKYDELHKPARLRIARTMKRFCGSSAFPYPTDLKAGATYPNDGLWMSKDTAEALGPSEISRQIHSSLYEKISEQPGLTRKQKRALKSRGGLKLVASEILSKPLTKEDLPNLPISEDFLKGRYLERFIAGKISDRDLSREFLKWLSDPEEFIQLWYEYAGKENPLESTMRNSFQNLTTAFEKFKELQSGADELYRSAKNSHRRMHNILHESDLPLEFKKLIALPERPKKLKIPDAKLGLDGLFGIGRCAQFDHYMNILRDRKAVPQSSDFLDLLHLIYLPEVDVMRCDRRMANLMSDCPDLQTDKIVSTLKELPSVIEGLKDGRRVR